MAADIPHLLFCKLFFQEVLRLYPSVWLLHLRKALNVDVLPSGSSIAIGTEIWVSPYATQRHPQMFSQPEDFDPLRFHNPWGDRKAMEGFLSFGAGPRRCLGEGFAMMEAILIMASFLTFVKLEELSNQDIAPDRLMTLRMKGVFFVKVTKKGFTSSSE